MNEKEIVISVIMPTYNRCGVVEQCLRNFENQTMRRESFEVVVSDDGSQDGTKDLVERISATSRLNIRYLWQQNRGANAARNHAIGEAKGDILLFINDDTIPVPAMLGEHCKTHLKYPQEHVSVLGKMTISPDMPYSIFARLHLDASYDRLEGKDEVDWHYFYTCNVSVKKSFLVKFGLFEEKMRYHEDLELSERLSHHGLRIMYNPAALGYHYHHLKEEEFLGIARRDGKALAVWHRKSPHLADELASVGYYLAIPYPQRLRYIAGDAVFNKFTRPVFLILARFLSRYQEDVSIAIYRKLFQSLKREAIRDETDKH